MLDVTATTLKRSLCISHKWVNFSFRTKYFWSAEHTPNNGCFVVIVTCLLISRCYICSGKYVIIRMNSARKYTHYKYRVSPICESYSRLVCFFFVNNTSGAATNCQNSVRMLGDVFIYDNIWLTPVAVCVHSSVRVWQKEMNIGDICHRLSLFVNSKHLFGARR